MLAHQHLPSYTYNDYQSWKGDWELIGGIPYAMSPSPKGGHQFTGAFIIAQLIERTRHCEDCFVYYEHDWIIAEDTIVRPDIYITCDGKVEDYLRTAPHLVVEILSLVTKKKDRELKFKLYEKEAVPYYLIIDTEQKKAQIYLLIEAKYQLIATKSTDAFEFELKDRKISLDFSAIWD